MPSVTSVSPVSGKLGPASALHTLNNSGDMVAEGSISISLVTLRQEAVKF